MEKLFTIIGMIVTAVVGVTLLSLLLAYPTKWIWNSTLPELFAFKTIGVWMAWKINFLCATLFKSNNFKVNTD